MAGDPTPEQQADYLVRKMEQTIRDNRTAKGMSFATWQTIAREEIINVLRAAERRNGVHDRLVARLVLVSASALVTIAFWGTLVTINQSYGLVAGIITMVAGAALLFVGADYGIRRAIAGYSKQKRGERLANIEDLDRSIKRMENRMQKKRDQMKEKMEEMNL